MSSPMQQSLKMLREAGWHPEIVEYFHAFGRVKIDFCNFADIVFFKPGGGIHACQVFYRREFAPHIKKIKKEPRALLWLQSGGRILLHGWKKENVGRRTIWTCKGIELTEKHFKKNENVPDSKKLAGTRIAGTTDRNPVRLNRAARAAGKRQPRRAND